MTLLASRQEARVIRHSLTKPVEYMKIVLDGDQCGEKYGMRRYRCPSMHKP
jgi:hypothetical protein